MNGLASGCGALGSVAAVFVARRALSHARATERREEGETDAAVRARVDAVLSEYAEKFERAFTAIERTEAARQRHELDCAKDKATLLERMEQFAKLLAALENRVSSWGQQMGFVGRDIAEVQRRVADREPPRAP